MAFAVYGQVIHGANLSSTVKTLSRQNAILERQIHDRQQEISQAESAAWLEEQARKLGYVMPGEHVYVLTSPGTTAAAGGGVNAPLPTFQPSPSPGATPSPSQVATPSASPTPPPFTLQLAPPAPAH